MPRTTILKLWALWQLFLSLEGDFDLLARRKHIRRVATALLVMSHLGKASQSARRSSRSAALTCNELLPDPRKETPWQALYDSEKDQAYIATMGVDVATFDYIMDSGFEYGWDTQPIARNDINPAGAPRIGGRSLTATGGLGLLLHHLLSTVPETGLQQIFALVPSVLSRYISFALPILLSVLRENAFGAISWPNPAAMQAYSDIIKKRHPRIDGAFGFMDGLNLPVGASTDPNIENATYNGWVKSHKISSVFVFAPDGKFEVFVH
jgi:hypothetical protein